ncbi:ATP-binding protein [Nannocystis bainbridge]|uniref:ATP-binding protein n=1 Tax=Nannocystis bainbridge TaxID=2995303 RepID=A0ABT5EB80_9BACT|nr:ATP-binding protein [Nannocystis bainbridge]MDC0723130.1 ATP-binding protein [Nannocystis bainbridge]
MARAPEITNVGDALEGLVHQFADPWAFLRELVQNSIDAGSPQLEVRIEHDAQRGAMIVEVADAGEGMTREIIDTRLTRLFSSAKEGDYTKIGRFGIGFVSVFAIDPEVVCVDTGRAGEWWRVVFRRDRSFERIRLHDPVEGTTVRLYKAASATEVETARARARETLAYWCKHVKIELLLDGERVSGPLELAGLCQVRHEEEGTALVMAIVPEAEALRGYYHGGLTLHEERDASLPYVAFKIDSRFLEHTLTRDNVIRDENYAKAMTIVQAVARGQLMDQVFAALERIAAGEVVPDEERALLLRCAEAALKERQAQRGWWAAKVLPTVGGPPLSMQALREQAVLRAVMCATAMSPVVAALQADRHVVIACTPRDAIATLVRTATGAWAAPVTQLCTALPLAPAEAEAWEPLCAGLAALLKASGRKIRVVTVGRFDYAESAIAERVAITQARFGELTKVEDVGLMASGWLASGRVVVLSALHPTLLHLRAVATREPELAAYLAIKSFFLHGELSAAVDAELASKAAEARWRRMDG